MTASGQHLLAVHRDSCEAYRIDLAVRCAMQQPSPEDELDDISKRRLYDKVMIAASQTDLSVAQRTRTRSLVFAISAAAAATAIIIVGTFAARRSPSGDMISKSADDSAGAVSTPPKWDPVGTTRPRFVRPNWNNAEQHIETGDNSGALTFPTGISVLVAPYSDLKIAQLDSDGIELALYRGEVLASVDPTRRGPPFSISTQTGRAVVTGTIFSVSTSTAGDDIAVLRGRVSAVDRMGGPPPSLPGNGCH